MPRKSLTDKAIILDIDETLVHTEDDMTHLDEMGVLTHPTLAGETYIISLDEGNTKMWGTKRPHLDEFLLFCFTYFDKVCVWSAGQKDYVHTLVDHLFAPFQKPHIVFTFDDCIQNEEEDWIKPLEKFYEHPKAKGNIFPESTFVIDDRDYTFGRNTDNGVLIPPYSPRNLHEMQEEETHLTRLRGWLMQPSSRFASDVRSLNKSHIFSQSPEKYAQIIQKHYNL